jgi:hypothetical protein
MAKYLPGTKIKISDLNRTTDIRTGESYEDMLRNSDDKNDMLFHIMYEQQGAQGKGQGNPFVGKLQSSQYKMEEGPTWAEEAVKSESGTSDIYRQRDEGGELTGLLDIGEDFGEAMTADDVARSTEGVTRFTGTNIPTTGFTPAQIANYERRIAADIAQGNWQGANDVLYDIALERGKLTKPEGWTYTKPGGDVIRNQFEQGNPYIGMLQSDMYTLTDPRASTWAQTVGGGPEDEYKVRDAGGNLTGDTVKFNADNSSYTVDSAGNVINRSGIPTYSPGQRGAGGSGEYLSTPYSRPALQDWSALAPPTGPGLLGSAPAQQALLANNLAAYQPQAQGGVLDYAPRGGSAWAPRTYTTTPLVDQTTTTTNNTTTTDNGYTGPLGNQWDSYHDWYMADRPSWGQAGYTTSPLGGHQAALNRQYEAYSAPLLAAGTNAVSYGDWFGGPLSGGILSNLGKG